MTWLLRGPRMTVDELLDDLDARCRQAEIQLIARATEAAVDERNRLLGKAAGVALVHDWLRGYR